MFIGRVIGKIISTCKNERLEGAKFLVVQPLDKNYKEEGIPIISLDFTQAGLGDLVYLVKGREASIPWEIKNAPIDASIVGIIDKVGR